MARLSGNLFALSVGLGREATLTLGHALYRLEGESSIDAVLHTSRVSVTEIANQSNFLPLGEVRCAEGASPDAFSAADAFLIVDAYHGHAAVDMSCPGRAHLDAGRTSAIDTHDWNVQALAHESHHTDARERGHERPFMGE
jgi:hypothetical protein